jgi:2-haloacid dehalogenase
VSSNFWDVSGASSFGFHTFWINRNKNLPDELGFEPTATVQRLNELPPYLN